MIVEVAKGDKDKHRKNEKQKRRRRRHKAPNLLGLSMGGRVSGMLCGQAGLPDEKAVAGEDDDEDDDSEVWRVYLLYQCFPTTAL
jgi:hypothetical protein